MWSRINSTRHAPNTALPLWLHRDNAARSLAKFFQMNQAAYRGKEAPTRGPFGGGSRPKAGQAGLQRENGSGVGGAACGTSLGRGPCAPQRVSEFLPQRGDRSFAGIVIALE